MILWRHSLSYRCGFAMAHPAGVPCYKYLRGNRDDFGALSLPKSTACRGSPPGVSK